MVWENDPDLLLRGHRSFQLGFWNNLNFWTPGAVTRSAKKNGKKGIHKSTSIDELWGDCFCSYIVFSEDVPRLPTMSLYSFGTQKKWLLRKWRDVVTVKVGLPGGLPGMNDLLQPGPLHSWGRLLWCSLLSLAGILETSTSSWTTWVRNNLQTKNSSDLRLSQDFRGHEKQSHPKQEFSLQASFRLFSVTLS